MTLPFTVYPKVLTYTHPSPSLYMSYTPTSCLSTPHHPFTLLCHAVSCIISSSARYSLLFLSHSPQFLFSRYCAVTSPLHYSMTITRGRSVRLIVGVWTLALLYALPQLLAHTHAHLRPASRLSACPSGTLERQYCVFWLLFMNSLKPGEVYTFTFLSVGNLIML